jgi:hypothetical protein
LNTIAAGLRKRQYGQHDTPEPGIPALPIFWRALNKRKRVALAKRRTKKKKLKARAQAAR